MRKKLKRASIKKYSKIFAEGRETFPKDQFNELIYTGHTTIHRIYGKIISYPSFKAIGVTQYSNSLIMFDEAVWSE